MSSSVVRERMSILERGVDQTAKRPDFLDVIIDEHRSGNLPYKEAKRAAYSILVDAGECL